MDSHEHIPHQRAAWGVLAIVCLPVFIGALDLTIISAVLPDVIISLNLTVKEHLDQASWAVNGYLLAYAISMTFAGRLSDLFGRRVVYSACLLIFMLGSYLVTAYDSALINSWINRFHNIVLHERPPSTGSTELRQRYLNLIIVGRVVQALGAGAMVPVTLALVGDLFPPGQRGKPLGLVGAVDTLGWVLGHLYGGVMVRLFGKYGEQMVDAAAGVGLRIAVPSWETLFILNVPVSLLALGGAWWALRHVPRPYAARQKRFDWGGALFIMLALIGLNLGLGTSPEAASTTESLDELQGVNNGVLLLGAGAAFAIFVWIEANARHPLIRLGLFRKRNFSAASLTNFLVGFCLAIGLVSAPLLVNFRADSPTSEDIQRAAYIAGILLSGLTVPMALAAVPGGWLSERFGYRLPTTSGLGLAAVGFLLAGLTWRGDTPFWIMGVQMAIIGVGLGLTISPIGTTVLNDAREEERGTASALILILRLIGMTVAISSLTIYSLERVDTLMAQTELGGSTEVGEVFQATITSQFDAAVQAIREMQFIGALASGIALLVAFRLRGGRGGAPARPAVRRSRSGRTMRAEPPE
jgi:MFS family permease